MIQYDDIEEKEIQADSQEHNLSITKAVQLLKPSQKEAQDLWKTKKEIEKDLIKLQEHIEEIKEGKLIVYGSSASGLFTKSGNDLDLTIILKDPKACGWTFELSLL